MTFGEEGKMQSRLTTLDDVAAVLDVFQKYGHEEVDTARMYKYVFFSGLHHPSLDLSAVLFYVVLLEQWRH